MYPRLTKMLIFLAFILILCVVDCEDQSGSYFVVEGPEPEIHSRRKLFNVYWNVPTMQCASKGIKFTNLTEKYGIIQNERDNFLGGAITILYDPGIFPALLKNESDGKLLFRNGGVPQDGDLKRHLEKLEAVIERDVPPDFKGIGVIDFESWRPIFRQNFGNLELYKQVSMDLERSRHPFWPSSMIQDEAAYQFEKAGEQFMLETLMLAKRLRKGGKWGYYAYPYCFNAKSAHGACASKVPEENDRISWLWEQSTSIFPSLYSMKDVPTEQLQKIIKGRIKEAKRNGGEGALILPYFWYKYRDSGFMAEQDLRRSLDTLHRSDADGVIIWGSSHDVDTLEKCKELYRYVKNILGPAVARHTRTIDKKSENLQNKLIDTNITDSFNKASINISESNNNFSIRITNNYTKINKVEVLDDDKNIQFKDEIMNLTLFSMNETEPEKIFHEFLASLLNYNLLNGTDVSVLNPLISESNENNFSEESQSNHSNYELNATNFPTESLLDAPYNQTINNYYNITSLDQKDLDKALYLNSLNKKFEQNLLNNTILSNPLSLTKPDNHEMVNTTLLVSNSNTSGVSENFKIEENIMTDVEQTTISAEKYSGIVFGSAVPFEINEITEKSSVSKVTESVEELSTVEIDAHKITETTTTSFESTETIPVTNKNTFVTSEANLTPTDQYSDTSTLSSAQDTNSKQYTTDGSIFLPFKTNGFFNDKKILIDTASIEPNYKQQTDFSSTDSVDISFENEDAIEIYSNFTEVDARNETFDKIRDYFYPYFAV